MGSRSGRSAIGEVGPNFRVQYPGARGTPTVDGEYLYAIGSNGDLVCMETATGNIRWHKDLRTDFGGKPGWWAYSESPLIDGDVLVSRLAAQRRRSWRSTSRRGTYLEAPVSEGDTAAYSSVTIANVDGVKEYVQFLQKGVVGVDAKTGKV